MQTGDILLCQGDNNLLCQKLNFLPFQDQGDLTDGLGDLQFHY